MKITTRNITRRLELKIHHHMTLDEIRKNAAAAHAANQTAAQPVPMPKIVVPTPKIVSQPSPDSLMLPPQGQAC